MSSFSTFLYFLYNLLSQSIPTFLLLLSSSSVSKLYKVNKWSFPFFVLSIYLTPLEPSINMKLLLCGHAEQPKITNWLCPCLSDAFNFSAKSWLMGLQPVTDLDAIFFNRTNRLGWISFAGLPRPRPSSTLPLWAGCRTQPPEESTSTNTTSCLGELKNCFIFFKESKLYSKK